MNDPRIHQHVWHNGRCATCGEPRVPETAPLAHDQIMAELRAIRETLNAIGCWGFFAFLVLFVLTSCQ